MTTLNSRSFLLQPCFYHLTSYLLQIATLYHILLNIMAVVRRSPARTTEPEHPPTIEEWVALKDPFRVIAQGHHLSCFLQKAKSDIELLNIYEKNVKPLMAQVLGQHSLSPTRWGQSKSQETFIIETNDIDTTFWSAAANAILELFVTNGALNATEHIQMGIRNPRLMYRDYSQSVLWHEKILLEGLHDIEEPVLLASRGSLGSSFSSISCHMRVDGKTNSPQSLLSLSSVVLAQLPDSTWPKSESSKS